MRFRNLNKSHINPFLQPCATSICRKGFFPNFIASEIYSLSFKYVAIEYRFIFCVTIKTFTNHNIESNNDTVINMSIYTKVISAENSYKISSTATPEITTSFAM